MSIEQIFPSLFWTCWQSYSAVSFFWHIYYLGRRQISCPCAMVREVELRKLCLYNYEIETDATDQHIHFQIWLRWWKKSSTAQSPYCPPESYCLPMYMHLVPPQSVSTLKQNTEWTRWGKQWCSPARWRLVEHVLHITLHLLQKKTLKDLKWCGCSIFD